jgi:hypothetical protein
MGLLMWDTLSEEWSGLLMWGALSDKRSALLASAVFNVSRAVFYRFTFETPPTWRARFL